MISFRYHLTTLVAIFLALAVGVVLGGGPLSELGRSDSSGDRPSATLKKVQEQRDQAEKALEGAAPTLLKNGLKDRLVTVLRMPGVEDATFTALTDTVAQAGGTAQVWTLTDGLVGAGDKALVDTLGAQLAKPLPTGSVTEGASTYVRMGELLGLALATSKPEGEAGNATGEAILASLRTAKLLEGPATAANRAPLVLVVSADPDLADGVDQIHGGLLQGLAARSVGVVAASTSGSDLAASLDAQDLTATVAVVDGVEAPAGRLSAAMALVRSITTPGGAFGATGADGFLPLL